MPLKLDLLILTLRILTINHFNYAYKDKQNIYWQVGLYTYVAITT